MASLSAFSASQPAVAAATLPSRAVTGDGPSADRLDGYGEQSLSFGDFLSIFNPLQHIPVVGSIYRAITGDTIAPAARVIGGGLFGGPMGLIASAFNAIIEQTTGSDLGEKALALVMPNSGGPAPASPQYAALPDAKANSAAPTEEVTTPTAADEPADPPVTLASSEAGAELPIFARTTPRTGAPGTPNAKGLTLADYRAAMGQPMPVIDSMRSPSSTTAPVRFQSTTPLGDRTRTALPPTPRDATPLPASVEREAENDERKADEAANDPFVAAMMRGLDRYREMKQGRSSPAVIDTAL